MNHLLLTGVVCMLVSVFSVSAQEIDFKKYKHISIEKHYKDTDFELFVQFAKKNSDKSILVIENPKFTCEDTGFTQKDIYQHTILYGTKKQDGSITLSEKDGDFIAESFVNYFHNEAFCSETTRHKGSELFGTKFFAVLRKK